MLMVELEQSNLRVGSEVRLGLVEIINEVKVRFEVGIKVMLY